MSEEASTPLSSSPPAAGGRGGGGNNRQRRRNRNRNASKSKSRSPTREEGGRSPTRRTPNKSQSPIRQHYNSNSNSKSPPRSPRRTPGKKKPPKPSSEMTVIVNRCDLWDSAAHFQPDESQHLQYHHPDAWVATYLFAPDVMSSERPKPPDFHSVAVARVPHTIQKLNLPATNAPTTTEGGDHICDVIDTKIPNPHDPSVVHDKYWAQRRRLFSRFDRGIRLDSEGWYSVTPEIIADHVAHRVANLAAFSPAFQNNNNNGQGIVILDAFCGCGGNSISFGKIPSHLISKVVCVDTDRSKLLKAAHNASLYDIPKDKLIFVECNSAFILQYCYKNGDFVLDQPATTMPQYMPKPVMSKTYAGYQVGGLDLLPRHIDAIFMDPPWGGVDYEVLGKNGYDLQKNMKIQVGPAADEYHGDGDGVGDDFFDMFTSQPAAAAKSQRARKANFNKKKEGDFIDGMELLRVATEATSSRVVVYDLPRNTNKTSLGKCALGAGYRGNVKLEEHYLNGRLKTVTAYMGACYGSMINSLHEADAVADNKTNDDAQA